MDVGGRDALLTIGAFARRSRLSPKALRLYDRLGVLAPAEVDGGTGYRRYREGQLEDARLVVSLRRLDMPLAAVAEVLAAPPGDRAALVAAHWRALEARATVQRALAAHVHRQLTGDPGDEDMEQVEEREVPEQLVLTEQRHLTVDQLSDWIGAALGRLQAAAARHGGVAGPFFVVYHGMVDEDSDGPVEVCVPVAADGPEDAVRAEPAHREGFVRLTRAEAEFPQILSAYDAVERWARADGRRPCGPPREVYFGDWPAAAPADEVVDVAWPVAG